jgi:hypothetical protein
MRPLSTEDMAKITDLAYKALQLQLEDGKKILENKGSLKISIDIQRKPESVSFYNGKIKIYKNIDE